MQSKRRISDSYIMDEACASEKDSVQGSFCVVSYRDLPMKIS